MKLGILRHLYQFFSSHQLLTVYKGLVHPCMEYFSHVWEGAGFQSHNLIRWGGIKSFSSHQLFTSDWLSSALSLFAGVFHLLVSSITFFMLPALFILLTACLPSCSLATHDFLPLTPILSNSLLQELTLAASVFPNSCDLTLFKREVSRHLSLTFG